MSSSPAGVDAGALPTDVVLQAETLNTSWNMLPSTADEPVPEYCPTKDEARGLDSNSQAIVRAFLDYSMIYVKSAGNFEDDLQMECLNGSEISAPGASAAALVVGNLDVEDLTAEEMQGSDDLHPWSARGPTRDGRTYPMLVAPGTGCGVAHPFKSGSDGGQARYDNFSGTSAASATVAGAALLFKQWYLANHMLYANVPGRVMSNLLNMADGFVGTHTDVPAAGWGLGRFRLRLYEEGGMSGDWARATRQVELADGETEVVDLGSIWPDGRIPSGATRLRVTVWWLEPNTGYQILAGSWAAFLETVEQILERELGESAAEAVLYAVEALLESIEVTTDAYLDLLEWMLSYIPMVDEALIRALIDASLGGQGVDEGKADIQATLAFQGDGRWGASVARSDGNHVIRLQYEDDASSTRREVPTGEVLLTLQGVTIPSAERYFDGAKRTLYVSWFWECGPDLSLIGCPSESMRDYLGSRGETGAAHEKSGGGTVYSTPQFDQAPLSSVEAAATLAALERKVVAYASARTGFECSGGAT